MEILTNPIVVSVIVMSVLCLLKMNVLFAILVAAIVAGSTGGLAIDKTVSILIGGMGGNSETALSYILLGTLAVAIGRSGVADIAARKITKVVGTKKAAFVFLIAFVSCFSQNLIPVHIHPYPDSPSAGCDEPHETGPESRGLRTDLRAESTVCFPSCWVRAAVHDHHQGSDGGQQRAGFHQ